MHDQRHIGLALGQTWITHWNSTDLQSIIAEAEILFPGLQFCDVGRIIIDRDHVRSLFNELEREIAITGEQIGHRLPFQKTFHHEEQFMRPLPVVPIGGLNDLSLRCIHGPGPFIAIAGDQKDRKDQQGVRMAYHDLWQARKYPADRRHFRSGVDLPYMPGIDQELRSRFENEQQKAMLNIMFTANWFRSMQVSWFKPFGISPQQYNILRILRGAKGRMNMQNVKQRMVDRAPNATRLTDKLIAKGLVERERCEEDRRVIHVRISEKGSDLLSRIDTELRPRISDDLKDLSEEDARQLNRILDQLRG